MENLNKENIWNDLMLECPNTMKEFCAWVDEYKKQNDWDNLFNARTIEAPVSGFNSIVITAPKFHEIPIAMQHGIIQNFLLQRGRYDSLKVTLNKEVSLQERVKESVINLREAFFELEEKQ